MAEATRGEGFTVEVGFAIPGVFPFKSPAEDGDAGGEGAVMGLPIPFYRLFAAVAENESSARK